MKTLLDSDWMRVVQLKCNTVKKVLHQCKQWNSSANNIFTITAEILARSLANFYCQQADRHMKFIIYVILTQRAREENLKKSICHFLTNRKRPFFRLANKRARRIMNLVASD